MLATDKYRQSKSYASAIASRSTTRHGVSGECSDRKRAIFWFMAQVTSGKQLSEAGINDADRFPPEGGRLAGRVREQDAGKARPKGPRRGVPQLKLLGSVIRPPRPRWRVPRRTASGQGAMALIGIATISTSLSGPAPALPGRPDCQKGRVTSLHNHHGP